MKMKVVIDNQTYEVDVKNIHTRPVIAMVEDERYEVWPETETPVGTGATVAPAVAVSEQVQSPASSSASVQGAGGKDVAAPLPGVIVAVLVKPGDPVTKGQELCTLEAMKMKNGIRSNRDGIIASVEVAVGDQVGHGQVLMTFSD